MNDFDASTPQLDAESSSELGLLYRALFDQSPNGILLVDPNGNFIDFNEAAHALLGYSRPEFRTLRIYDLDLSWYMENRLIETGEPVPDGLAGYEARFMTKEGAVRWVKVFTRSILLSGRTVLYMIWQDITDRKQAEEVLLRSNDQLEALVEERTAALRLTNAQLRNLSSHLQKLREAERFALSRELDDDLAQSITALKISLSLLVGSLPPDEPRITRSTTSLRSILDSIMERLRKIGTDLRPHVLEHLGLAAAMQRQVEEFEKKTGISCRLLFEPYDIIVDRDRAITLYRILQEVLANSAKHAKASKIVILLKQYTGHLTLVVKDNGSGIETHRLSNPESIGLIEIRERVYGWNGTLDIEGKPGRGTTITVRLPLPAEEHEQAGAPFLATPLGISGERVISGGSGLGA